MLLIHYPSIDFKSSQIHFSSSQAREAVVLEHGEIPAAGNPVACPQVRPHEQKVDLAPGPALKLQLLVIFWPLSLGATWTSYYCRPMTSLIGRILSEERRREGWWWNTNQWFLSLPVKWWRGVHLGIEQMCIKIDIVFSYDDDINFDYSKCVSFSLHYN